MGFVKRGLARAWEARRHAAVAGVVGLGVLLSLLLYLALAAEPLKVAGLPVT